MTHFNDRPIPIVDSQRCDGCGLCMRACPTKALGLQDGKAVVVDPLVCEYSGLCEAVCPTQAISRPFEIVVACIANEEGKAFLNSTNVIEKEPTSAYNAD